MSPYALLVSKRRYITRVYTIADICYPLLILLLGFPIFGALWLPTFRVASTSLESVNAESMPRSNYAAVI